VSKWEGDLQMTTAAGCNEPLRESPSPQSAGSSVNA
jgi:hypothetical protein